MSLPALHQAASDNNVKKIKELLKTGALINEKAGKNKRTPLHYAAYNNKLEAAEALLDAGADIKAGRIGGCTALHDAAYWAGKEVVQLLLKRGSTVGELTDIGSTPLHLAAESGNVPTAEVLVANGANVNTNNKDQWTAMHTAAKFSGADFIQFLISKGGAINPCTKIGNHPLNIAVQKGNPESTDALLKAGADVQLQDSDGWTPIFWAIQKEDGLYVEKLLKYGANATHQTKKGNTPMHYCGQMGNAAGAKVLKNAGQSTTSLNKDGSMPIHLASKLSPKPEIVDFFLKNGATVSDKSKNGSVPLKWAAEGGKIKNAELLLKAGSDIEAPDNDNDTPIFCAAKFGGTEMTKWFIQKGAKVQVANKNGLTPLHYAAENKDDDSGPAEALLNAGAQIDYQGTYKGTPLHNCALTHNETVAAFLLKRGANPTIKNKGDCDPAERTKKLHVDKPNNFKHTAENCSLIKVLEIAKNSKDQLAGMVQQMENSHIEEVKKERIKSAKQRAPQENADPQDLPDKQLLGAAQVFISYNWDIQDQVKQLKDKVEKNLGIKCWMDIGQMGGGDELYAAIDDGIRDAKVVVSCVTTKYSKSENCQDEVSLARLVKTHTIPILMEKMDWPPRGPMSMIFARKLYIDCTGGLSDDKLAELCNQIKHKL